VVAKETSSKKVFVFGHVQKPGTFAYEDGMTVIQAITLAGGLAQFGQANRTSVIRPTDGGPEQKYLVPVEDIGTGRAPNFYLQPGDIVFVPESILF
jgi:polysaccharide export outer membrane protein